VKETKNIMKKTDFNFRNTAIVFSLAISALIYAHNVSALQKLDRIVAIVNDDVISEHELEMRVNDFAGQLKLSKNNPSDIQALRKQVLENMIQNKIQLQKASEQGITIDDVTLNRMLENLAASNNLTLNKLRSTLAKEGIEFSRFREQTREELIIKQLQQRMVASKVTVSDQEVHQHISKNLQQASANTRYHVLHILIATPETARPDDIEQSRKKAERLYLEIQQGKDFRELAINESDGRNALQGGDLGWRAASELPEVFVDAINELKKSETSKPVRSASGFHLLKVVEKSSSEVIIVQTHARHILIRTDKETTDDQAQKTLNTIKDKINNGEDFAALAKQFSQDPGSKDTGGDLGWTEPGQFVTEFEDAMKSLKDGQISEPFRSQFGWHLVQVIGRRNQDKTLANIETKARQSIRQRKIDEELRLWLRRIREEAYVEYTDKTLIQNQ